MSGRKNWRVTGCTCSLRIFLFESISIERSISWSTSSWRLNNAVSGAAILTLREPPRLQGDSWPRRMEEGGDGVHSPRKASSFNKLGKADVDAWVDEALGTFNWWDSWSARSKDFVKDVWPSSSSSSPHMSSWIIQRIKIWLWFFINIPLSCQIINWNLWKWPTFSKGISGDQSAESLINTDVSGLEMAPTETPPRDGLALAVTLPAWLVFLFMGLSSSSSSIQASSIRVRQHPTRSEEERLCCWSSFESFLMRLFLTIRNVSTLCSCFNIKPI